jgi:hypothetical protein
MNIGDILLLLEELELKSVEWNQEKITFYNKRGEPFEEKFVRDNTVRAIFRLFRSRSDGLPSYKVELS